ncbi:MAG: hypothetical protein HY784_13035, partial [Chloroflexi bacterium]|nr:hypothetical protein [Chloroflexota bacterium]
MSEPSSIERGLQLIERLIRLEVARMRAGGVPVGEEPFRGLYLSPRDADRLLAPGSGARGQAPDNGARGQAPGPEPEGEVARAELAALAAQAAREDDRPGRLLRWAGLAPFEFGLLLLCLAPEADPRFERLFAYVQDDVARRRPRVELALRLLADPADRPAARRALAAGAPLRRLSLLSLHGDPGRPPAPLPAKSLALDPWLAAFLLG